MSIPHIRSELQDDYAIKLSDDAIAKYIQRYQVMLAARQQDPEVLRRHYESVDEIVLSIDGLQPEKGHETLYVVRELTQKRVWFAEALIAATADEVQRLIAQAKQWAKSLNKTVSLWISDKQDAFVTGIAAEFPDVPHRYCDNHFLRDLAKPVLEADSHAKVQMRRKVRGLRKIEQAVPAAGAEAEKASGRRPEATATVIVKPANAPSGIRFRHRRGARLLRRSWNSLNDDQEAPSILPACEWPRLWRRFMSRSNGTWTRKRGFAESNWAVWPTASTGDWTTSAEQRHPRISGHREGSRDPRTWARLRIARRGSKS
jgi:hypothetical protein